MNDKRMLFRFSALCMLVVLNVVYAGSLAHVQEQAAPQIKGDWASSTCETRPAGNGKHLYLKRNFREGTAFASATLLFYADAACTLPTFTLVIAGPYSLGQPSPVVPGATEAIFSFTSAGLSPHTSATVRLLESAAPGTCGTHPWKINVLQDIYTTGGCSVLGVNFQTCPREYDLVKLDADRDLLSFGARPGDGGGLCTPQRRPTALQVPLTRSFFPDIAGHWISITCETRPGANGTKLYLLRDFREASTHSAATLNFFADAACTVPTFSVFIDGPSIYGERSPSVAGATETDFLFTNALLTARSAAAVQFLNSASPGSCGLNPWRINTPQNIFVTGGCSVLEVNFISCPQEYDLVKLDADRDLLFFGARPANDGGPCTPQQRPTALQVPLVKVA
jgi:hypothetical protein